MKIHLHLPVIHLHLSVCVAFVCFCNILSCSKVCHVFNCFKCDHAYVNIPNRVTAM